jgi:hypothetical protein
MMPEPFYQTGTSISDFATITGTLFAIMAGIYLWRTLRSWACVVTLILAFAWCASVLTRVTWIQPWLRLASRSDFTPLAEPYVRRMGLYTHIVFQAEVWFLVAFCVSLAVVTRSLETRLTSAILPQA